MHKEKFGLFIVMFSLLFFIIKLHKKHFEQFRFLNCELSLSDTKMSDEDFSCCEAKTFISKSGNEDHPSYSYYANIWDQCNKISTIDLSIDAISMVDNDAMYDKLVIDLEATEKELFDTQESYAIASIQLSNLETQFSTESNIYTTMLNKYSYSNTRYQELVDINSNLVEMIGLHNYKLALDTLDDVITNETMNNMGIHVGLKHLENDIQNQITFSLNKAFEYIPKLSDLYIHNVKLYESIEKNSEFINSAKYSDDQNQYDLTTSLTNSRTLYKKSIQLLNQSETTLFKISESIKELSSYLYQTNVDSTSSRKITIPNPPYDPIEITFENGRYRLPVTVRVDDVVFGKFIIENLFNKCNFLTTINDATCGNLPTEVEDYPGIEEDVTPDYKKQTIDANLPLSSSFFSTFLRYVQRDMIINEINSLADITNRLNTYFKYAFLIKTFSSTTEGTETTEEIENTSPDVTPSI